MPAEQRGIRDTFWLHACAHGVLSLLLPEFLVSGHPQLVPARQQPLAGPCSHPA